MRRCVGHRDGSNSEQNPREAHVHLHIFRRDIEGNGTRLPTKQSLVTASAGRKSVGTRSEICRAEGQVVLAQKMANRPFASLEMKFLEHCEPGELVRARFLPNTAWTTRDVGHHLRNVGRWDNLENTF